MEFLLLRRLTNSESDNTSSQISGLEAELLADLLSGAVRYDVEERSTAAEMLGHAWFSIASPK